MTLSAERITERVQKLRSLTIEGVCVDLKPYSREHDGEVIRLRSQPAACYFLNAPVPPSLATQQTWRTAYEARENDVMWIIVGKSGRPCGMTRLYDIEPGVAEKGSLVIDPVAAAGIPATLESEIKVIEAAFNTFEVDTLITRVREDNTNMLSINARFGFVHEAETIIRGARYLVSSLSRHAWKPDAFAAILTHFARRRR